jgi:hypothetical protein
MGPNEAAVLRVLERRGSVGIGYVAFAAGVSTRTARYHLRRFVQQGIAEEVVVEPHDIRPGDDPSAYRLRRPVDVTHSVYAVGDVEDVAPPAS